MSKLGELLREGPIAIAVGAHDFVETLRAEGVPVVEVDWRPPYAPDAEAQALLERLL